MAINSVAGGSALNSSASITLALPSFTLTAGWTVLVAVALASSTVSVSGISDTKGNAYTQLAAITNASGVRVEVWGCNSVAAQSNNVITITASASVLMAAAVEAWSGVQSPYIGNVATASGTDTNPSTSAVLQDGGNWMVGALGFVCASGDTAVASDGGAILQSKVPALTSVGVALLGQASSGTGTATSSVRLSAARAWAISAIELRTAVGASPFTPAEIPLPTTFSYDNSTPVPSGFYVAPDRGEISQVGSGVSGGGFFY